MVELKTEDELHPEDATTEQIKAVDPVDNNDDNDDLAPESERDCSEDNDVTVSESQIVMESDESDGEYLVYTGMVISSIDQVMTLNQKCVKMAAKIIEHDIFGEGSQMSTNQKQESTVFSLLIG